MTQNSDRFKGTFCILNSIQTENKRIDRKQANCENDCSGDLKGAREEDTGHHS